MNTGGNKKLLKVAKGVSALVLLFTAVDLWASAIGQEPAYGKEREIYRGNGKKPFEKDCGCNVD